MWPFKKKRKGKIWVNWIYQNEIHIVPVDDLMWHMPVDCECLPETEPHETVTGTINWLVIHNAKDGRK